MVFVSGVQNISGMQIAKFVITWKLEHLININSFYIENVVDH
jgi:hypothetical protein